VPGVETQLELMGEGRELVAHYPQTPIKFLKIKITITLKIFLKIFNPIG
jgi:hypothetical protein